MNWTKEKPTKDGYYWYQRDENEEPTIISFEDGLVYWDGENSTEVEDENGLWYGPLQPPSLFEITVQGLSIEDPRTGEFIKGGGNPAWILYDLIKRSLKPEEVGQLIFWYEHLKHLANRFDEEGIVLSGIVDKKKLS